MFQKAFDRFVLSRSVQVPVRTRNEIEVLHARRKEKAPREIIFSGDRQPQLGQADSLKLMPFQVVGVDWLCKNWWTLQHCILADEMGLVSYLRPQL